MARQQTLALIITIIVFVAILFYCIYFKPRNNITIEKIDENNVSPKFRKLLNNMQTSIEREKMKGGVLPREDQAYVNKYIETGFNIDRFIQTVKYYPDVSDAIQSNFSLNMSSNFLIGHINGEIINHYINNLNQLYLWNNSYNSCYISSIMNSLALLDLGSSLGFQPTLSGLYDSNSLKPRLGIPRNDTHLLEVDVILPKILDDLYFPMNNENKENLYVLNTETISEISRDLSFKAMRQIGYTRAYVNKQGQNINYYFPYVPLSYYKLFVTTGLVSFIVNLECIHYIAVSIVDGKYIFVCDDGKMVKTEDYNIYFNDMNAMVKIYEKKGYKNMFIETVFYNLSDNQRFVRHYSLNPYRQPRVKYVPVDGQNESLWVNSIVEPIMDLIYKSSDYMDKILIENFNSFVNLYRLNYFVRDLNQQSRYERLFENMDKSKFDNNALLSANSIYENGLSLLHLVLNHESWNYQENVDVNDLDFSPGLIEYMHEIIRNNINERAISTNAYEHYKRNHEAILIFHPLMYYIVARTHAPLMSEVNAFYAKLCSEFFPYYYPIGLSIREQEFYNLFVETIFEIMNKRIDLRQYDDYLV